MIKLFAKTVLILMVFTGSEANPRCELQGPIELEFRTLNRENEHCLSCIEFMMGTRNLVQLLCTDNPYYQDVYVNNDENIFSLIRKERPDNYESSYLGVTITSADFTTYTVDYSPVSRNNDLNSLDISKNDILIIPESFFFSFPHLLKLDISRNNLTSISSENFRYLNELQTLNLSRNSISHMADPFKYLNELFDIDLSHNKITNISKDLFDSQLHLENLNLSHNEMVHFDVHFQNYPHFPLDHLDLSFNKLENVSINMNIKRLTISHNNLAAFSLNLSESSVLLDLSHNKLEKISSYSMLNAVNIQHIDLSNNRLQYLPTASFRNQKLLKLLNISNNLFATSTFGPENNWPTFFLNFEALQTVNLDNNLWGCAELKEITYILRARSIKVVQGADHSSNNILGIKCFVYDRNNSNMLNGSKTEASQELGNEMLNEIIEYMLPKFKNLELQLNDTRFKMNEEIFNRSLIEHRLNRTEQNLTKLFTLLTYNSKQINTTIANVEKIKSNSNSVAVDTKKLNQVVNNILLKFENLQKHINDTQQNIETSIDANPEIVNKVLAEVSSRLKNNTIPNKGKDVESNAKSSINESADGNRLIPKAEKQILESETLLKKISEGTNAISGMVIQNLLLFSILIAMLYIMFVTIKTKRQIASRDELNLVHP